MFLDALLRFLDFIVQWLQYALYKTAIWVLDWVFSALPDGWVKDNLEIYLDKFLIFMEYANCWIALDWGVTLFSLYETIALTVIVLRIGIKFLPFGIGKATK
jgi:hypothetical protein